MKTYDIFDYIIHSRAVKQLKTWLQNFENRVPDTPNVAIIYGPPGSGKSTLVYSLFKKYDYDLVSFVPNIDKTHKYEIKRLSDLLNGKNIMMMIDNKKKGVLFDDIEIGSSGDRGFVSDILSLIDTKKKGAKKINKNPLILTINSKISSKKTQAINKFSEVITLNRLSKIDLFNLTKRYFSDIGISDIELHLLCDNCQGDIRNLYQRLETLKKGGEVDEIDESWKLYSEKDIDIKALPSLERYANPSIKTSYQKYEYLFDIDALFIPAFVYENSWSVVNSIKYKNNLDKYRAYLSILSNLSNWANVDSIFNDYSNTYITDFSLFFSVVAPYHLIRKDREKFGYSHVHFKTSNLYSRISQSSFNGRSICDLSDQLSIKPSDYHTCIYNLYLLLMKNDKKLNSEIADFLVKSGIQVSDIDRLFRYNCLSKEIEKNYVSKKRIVLKKLMSKKD